MYAIELAGGWMADKDNRLSFRIKKESGSYDILTFDGVWEVGTGHQIIYRYEKAGLIRKSKKTHTLIFRGCWDIMDSAALSYVMDAGTDSRFDFETDLALFEEDRIKYEVGIKLSSRPKPVKRSIVLSGQWRVKKDAGLIFEIEYEGRRKGSITFGADAKLTDSDTISLKLRREADNRDIGVSLELSRKIFTGDGEAFLRALRTNAEVAILAGGAWRW
jgi:hypothetical protein